MLASFAILGLQEMPVKMGTYLVLWTVVQNPTAPIIMGEKVLSSTDKQG
jgi:hypothetical protein